MGDMDIQKVLLQVIEDRAHEARMCAEYCNRQLWDLAAERARVYRALDDKVTAILEGRASALYGKIYDHGDEVTLNVVPLRENSRANERT